MTTSVPLLVLGFLAIYAIGAGLIFHGIPALARWTVRFVARRRSGGPR